MCCSLIFDYNKITNSVGVTYPNESTEKHKNSEWKIIGNMFEL